MKIAIIGSRDYPALHLIGAYMQTLPQDAEIITGGARGVDQEAETQAKKRGLKITVYLPQIADLSGAPRTEYTKRYYARNQQIVDAADMIVAFTHRDTGGTWDAIRRARKKGIETLIIDEDGEIEQNQLNLL